MAQHREADVLDDIPPEYASNEITVRYRAETMWNQAPFHSSLRTFLHNGPNEKPKYHLGDLLDNIHTGIHEPELRPSIMRNLCEPSGFRLLARGFIQATDDGENDITEGHHGHCPQEPANS